MRMIIYQLHDHLIFLTTLGNEMKRVRKMISAVRSALILSLKSGPWTSAIPSLM